MAEEKYELAVAVLGVLQQNDNSWCRIDDVDSLGDVNSFSDVEKIDEELLEEAKSVLIAKGLVIRNDSGELKITESGINLNINVDITKEFQG